jgi:hypothetical protein
MGLSQGVRSTPTKASCISTHFEVFVLTLVEVEVELELEDDTLVCQYDPRPTQ